MRLLFLLVVAALEATAVSMPLAALTSAGPPWPLLLLAVALGWLADQVARRLPQGRERAALAAGAALGGLLLPSAALGGPLAALGALLPGGPAFLLAYALLLLGLYLVWRGARLDLHDGGSIGALFGRSIAVGVAALIAGAIGGGASPGALGHVAGLVGLGLLALALAHAQEAAGGRLAGLSWRWLATLLGAVGLVIVVGALGTSFVGGGAGALAAQTLIGLLLLPFAIVGAAMAWVFITFLAEPLTALIQAVLARLQLIVPPEAPPAESAPPGQGADAAFTTIQRMAEGATFLMALIPVVILVVAILLLRRRRQARRPADEERESLDMLASLGADLRDLLGHLRNPFARPLVGLRAALAALGADDPTTRVRRAYVGLLLLLEARERPRPPAATPAEFAPAAAAALDEPEPVTALTAAYEQARYNPAGAAPADAEAAELALRRAEARR